ncbi:MAG: M42 family metallopeptidase [Candidatus Bipolaricaulota bacterium]|nr:MAG: M42 family metallopeptidase [Candidatus Bipolaricaulota bacterium]
MSLAELLATLSDAFGVSGFEDEIRERIAETIKPYADEIVVDPLGNLLATRRGRSEKTLMLDAHMDEIGFLVKWVDEAGYLRVAPIGGWDPRTLPTHRVVIHTRPGEVRHGVIGAAPPHILTEEQRKSAPKIEDLFLDVGATSAEDVADLGIRIGDPLTIHYPFAELRDGYVTGKAFDDRAGCAVLLETARHLAERDLDLTTVFAFVIGEEVGLRGARTAAHRIAPDLAVAVEGTIGADMPGIKAENQPVRLRKGPALTVADRTIIVSRALLAHIEEIAARNDIPYQYKLPAYGGTDAGAIHITGGGIPSAVVSVPCRYVHSPTSTLHMEDLENTARLVCAITEDAPSLLAAAQHSLS